MSWVPMFALPNIRVEEPVEVPHLALAYSQDDRVKALAQKYKNFATFLERFSDEFGVQLLPSLLIWNDEGPQTYRSTETLAAFRDALKETKHEATAPVDARRPRILACWIYSQLNSARNAYLHGNPVTAEQLYVKESKRFLLDYAPVLYRVALTGFLKLQFTDKAPPKENADAYEDFEMRAFQFGKYQRNMESALATALIPRR